MTQTSKDKCVKDYSNVCKYRAISNDIFSKDWCSLKNDYCDNIKPNTKNDKGFWRKF